MFKTKLCLGVLSGIGIEVEEQIKMFKNAGFEGFFTMWDENLEKYRKVADEYGMIFQSVHAPFDKSAMIWQNNAYFGFCRIKILGNASAFPAFFPCIRQNLLSEKLSLSGCKINIGG